jgi:hypothetical protein
VVSTSHTLMIFMNGVHAAAGSRPDWSLAALLIGAVGVLLLLGIKERRHSHSTKSNPVRTGIRNACRTRPFSRQESNKGMSMLRITVHDKPRVLRFQLEGKLAGPWVRELEECWQRAVARQGKTITFVDLTGVTYINAAGQACLAALHRQGAEFIAADCLTKAIVAEITQAPLPDSAGPNGEGEAGRN